MTLPTLPRSFYARSAEAVARDLLGKTLVRDVAGATPLRATITETEAYVGEHDTASHARFGPTQRNRPMYGPPGHAYVYFVYGMHQMLNVVCANADDPQAVLLRAAQPLDGWDARLTGPGLLAKAFAVGRADNGADLVDAPPGGISIAAGETPAHVVVGPRIGIDFAAGWVDAPLRFRAVQSRSESHR